MEKAYSHLKHCCLDVFKLKAQAALDQAKELQGIEISLIDNGEYERNLKKLVQKIKAGATDARRLEDRVKQANDGSIQAFAAWEPVFADCVTLEKDSYHHPRLNWAKKTRRMRRVKEFVLGVLSGALIGAFLEGPLSKGFEWLWAKLMGLF